MVFLFPSVVFWACQPVFGKNCFTAPPAPPSVVWVEGRRNDLSTKPHAQSRFFSENAQGFRYPKQDMKFKIYGKKKRENIYTTCTFGTFFWSVQMMWKKSFPISKKGAIAGYSCSCTCCNGPALLWLMKLRNPARKPGMVLKPWK